MAFLHYGICVLKIHDWKQLKRELSLQSRPQRTYHNHNTRQKASVNFARGQTRICSDLRVGLGVLEGTEGKF